MINKLKQKNRWDDAFDARFLESLKSDSDRSLLNQGGARKLFIQAVAEISSAREEIDEEVREVNNKQTLPFHDRTDRVLTTHASPRLAKFASCILTAYFNRLPVEDC